MNEQNLSPKVTPTLLDRIYTNFTKITDWLIHGQKSKYPMPNALAWLFNTTAENSTKLDELTNLVTTLQATAVQKNGEIEQLKQTLAATQAILANVVEATNTQQVQQVQQVQQAEPEPTIELVDFDDVVGAGAESPNEQSLKVSAEAVGAGQLDVDSYKSLDDEIGKLLEGM